MTVDQFNQTCKENAMRALTVWLESYDRYKSSKYKSVSRRALACKTLGLVYHDRHMALMIKEQDFGY